MIENRLAETLAALRYELEAEEFPVSKYTENPEAFNSKLAKLASKLKKDVGVLTIRQNYRGTGSQKHRRQLWMRLPGDKSIDIWLDNGYIQIGGVIAKPVGVETSKAYDDLSPEQVYDWLVSTMKKAYPKQEASTMKEARELVQELRKHLGEGEDKSSTREKVLQFFKDNPNPKDSEVHAFAEKIGIDAHELEGVIYRILSDLLAKK